MMNWKADMQIQPDRTVHVLDSVYDLLVRIGGANEYMRQNFIQNHMDEKYPCTEWRFCGHLGFGGKYRFKTNKVDCYSEDETLKRLTLISELNAALAKVVHNAYGEDE